MFEGPAILDRQGGDEKVGEVLCPTPAPADLPIQEPDTVIGKQVGVSDMRICVQQREVTRSERVEGTQKPNR